MLRKGWGGKPPDVAREVDRKSTTEILFEMLLPTYPHSSNCVIMEVWMIRISDDLNVRPVSHDVLAADFEEPKGEQERY